MSRGGYVAKPSRVQVIVLYSMLMISWLEDSDIFLITLSNLSIYPVQWLKEDSEEKGGYAG